MKIENITIMVADDGKTFKRISDSEILGDKLSLGVDDASWNYIEVDSQPAEQEDVDIDGRRATLK